jgi:Uma2 family endonuclease
MEAAALLTSDQFLSMPMEYDASGNRVRDELIGGEVILIPILDGWHDIIKNVIAHILTMHLLENEPLNLRAMVGTAFKISECDVFVADVSVIRRERLTGEGRITIGAPEIAIEVISETDTAYHVKSKISAYLESGSSAVWVVFPSNRSIEVHTPGDIRDIKGDQIINDPLLPGFSMPAHAAFSF